MRIANHSQLDTKKNVWTINVIVATFVTIGNIVLPSFFWNAPQPPSFWCFPPIFFSGALASEVVIIGIFAAFSNSFYVVRLIWSIIATFVCSLLLCVGVLAAEGSSSMTSTVSPAIWIGGVGNLAVLGIGACIRWATGFHFSDNSCTELLPSSRSFNLLFLFKLTIAIALIMFVLKIVPIPLTTNSRVGPRQMLLILLFLALQFLFATGLIAASLARAMEIHSGKTSMAVLVVLFFVGTPTMIVAVRLFLITSMSFWVQWLATQTFYLGFISSMLIVFVLWRKAGLRLASFKSATKV